MIATTARSDLAGRQCKSCGGGVHALTQDEINALLQQLDGWTLQERMISKTYEFQNFYQTMAFVNAVAWIAQRENHHPDFNVSYRTCRLEYSTHDLNSLTENDFICAAKADALFKP